MSFASVAACVFGIARNSICARYSPSGNASIGCRPMRTDCGWLGGNVTRRGAKRMTLSAAFSVSLACSTITSFNRPMSFIRRSSSEIRYVASSLPMLLNITSVPRRPSSTIRVGATKRSPAAYAGVASINAKLELTIEVTADRPNRVQ